MASENDRRRGVRVAAGAGVVAWLVGVGVALAIRLLFGDPADPLQLLAAGVVFYYTFHLWPALPVLTAGNAVFAIFTPVSILLLFWAGFRTTVGTDPGSPLAAFRRGATVTVGYLAMALLSLPAFAIAVERSPFGEPLVTLAIVGTTGVAFPVVFGGLGGWLAGR